MKHQLSFRRDEEGISGAVTATLIIATLTMVFTGIYAIVIPVWVEDVETNHMHQVANDFITLKENIQSQIEQSDTALTMGTPIALKPDPTNNFFGTYGKTFPGTITIDPYSERFNLTNEKNTYEVYGSCQGAVYFVPKNQQYANGATMRFIYSNGAVMKVQVNDGIVIAAPVFNLVNESGNKTLYFSAIKLFGEPTSLSGSKSVTVETRTLYALVATYEGGMWDLGVNVTINATSTLGYMKVYKAFYEKRLNDQGYKLNVDYTSSGSGDSLKITIKNVKRVILYTGTVDVSLK